MDELSNNERSKQSDSITNTKKLIELNLNNNETS